MFPQAQQLQTAGVSLLVLSVGHHTDLAGLGQLATNRSFVLTTPGLDSLPHLSEGLQEVFMQLAHGGYYGQRVSDFRWVLLALLFSLCVVVVVVVVVVVAIFALNF